MKAYIAETGEIVENKAQAIERAKEYITLVPEAEYATVCYLNGRNQDCIWFEAGRRNVNGICNFVEVQ